MKRLLALLLALLMVLSLAACSGKREGDDASAGEQTDGGKDAARAGTRSDPYAFDDTIVIQTKGPEDAVVEYTLNLSEALRNAQVKALYPNYSVNEKLLAKGTIAVACDSVEDSINFDLSAVFITDSMNEEPAGIQTFKENSLNNTLWSVYPGGTYDIILMSSNEGVGNLDVDYIKINYTNVDGEQDNIWIAMPDASDNAVSGGDGETTGEPTATDAPEIPAMSGAELENALLEQPMYVESTKYVVQDARYKALYPDMLQAVVKNNSGTDVKNAKVAFAAWDSNGFPVKIEGKYDYGGGSYVKVCNYSDVNMVDGATYGKDSGMPLDSDTDNIATFKAIVVSYDDFDGNTWTNPYYDTWVEMYSDKRLSESA